MSSSGSVCPRWDYVSAQRSPWILGRVFEYSRGTNSYEPPFTRWYEAEVWDNANKCFVRLGDAFNRKEDAQCAVEWHFMSDLERLAICLEKP